QRPDPLEQRFALGGEGGREQTLVGLLQHLLVDSVPGKAQREAVIDAGALEQLANDVGVDAVNVVLGCVVLPIGRHVEGREILGQQNQLVVVGQFGSCRGGAQQQRHRHQNSFQHRSSPSRPSAKVLFLAAERQTDRGEREN